MCKYKGFSVATNSASPCQAPGREPTLMLYFTTRSATCLGPRGQCVQSSVGRKPALHRSRQCAVRERERIPQQALFTISDMSTGAKQSTHFLSQFQFTLTKVTASGRTGAEAETSNSLLVICAHQEKKDMDNLKERNNHFGWCPH